MTSDESTNGVGAHDGKYTVVARRYRPRTFQELVGQENVSQALSTAIRTNRVGHAYLFTGARGVGKTSTARIFAKALNTEYAGSDEALQVDISDAIDAGQDMDVIEIDGASNRGIEEIRSLRANVNVRPSRSRYKIYIIDEVHMLTVQAFNALLKTLEEPPEHVKFIFCTTDPEKIPITVLSRCQRFDFSPVKTDAILERLQFICQQEGAEADAEALRLVARRAAGSMRDSQSLLEQILSFSDGKITLDQVHAILGSADETLILETLQSLVERNGVKAIEQLEQAVSSGVDAGQFGEQLLDYLRDMMVAGVGGGPDLFRYANPNSFEGLKALAIRWGQMTLLAAIQMLDECLVKMRHSVQSRILMEVALVQMTQLQDLQRIHELLPLLANSGPAPVRGVPGVAVGTSVAAGVPKGGASVAGTASIESVAGARVNDETAQDVSEKKKDEVSHLVGGAAEQAAIQANQRAEESKAVERASVASESVRSGDATKADNVTQADSAIEVVESAGKAVVPSAVVPTAVVPAKVAPEKVAPEKVAAVEPSVSGAGVAEIWGSVLGRLDSFLAGYVGLALRAEAMSASEWRIAFPLGSELAIEFCEQAANKIALQQALSDVCQRPMTVRFQLTQEVAVTKRAEPVKQGSQQQQIREMLQHPLIARLASELGGEITRIDAAQGVPPPVSADLANKAEVAVGQGTGVQTISS